MKTTALGIARLSAALALVLLFAIVMSRLDLGFVALGFDAYKQVLGGDPRNMLMFCGVCLVFASFSVLWVREGRAGVVPVKSAAA